MTTHPKSAALDISHMFMSLMGPLQRLFSTGYSTRTTMGRSTTMKVTWRLLNFSLTHLAALNTHCTRNTVRARTLDGTMWKSQIPIQSSMLPKDHTPTISDPTKEKSE